MHVRGIIKIWDFHWIPRIIGKDLGNFLWGSVGLRNGTLLIQVWQCLL